MIILKIVGVVCFGIIAITGICAIFGLVWMFWAQVWEDLQQVNEIWYCKMHADKAKREAAALKPK